MPCKLALAIVVTAFLCAIDTSAAQAASHQLVEERSEPTAFNTRDALATVEANRPKVIARMVDQYRAPLEAHAITIDAFRAALWDLAPDRLLAASLADSIEEVSTIIAQAVTDPSRANAKDDPGTGANSWIGYSAGNNVASGTGSAVAAGTNNVASGQNSFVGAGTFNAANGQGSFVGGGTSNVANAISALVMGGFDNQATVIDSAVVAGAGNRATGARSVVVGGGYNLASGQWSFVGGGGRQSGSGAAGASAQDNVAAGDFSTVGGGQANRAGTALNNFATVAGGLSNTASGSFATVAGGGGNQALELFATVGGGGSNTASGFDSVVSGGTGNKALGDYSTVAGGLSNEVSGDYSFAVGHNAKANQDKCALFGLWSTNSDFTCQGVSNLFRVGANHGVDISYFSQAGEGGSRFVYIGDVYGGDMIHTSSGAHLTDAGVWSNASDRNLKEGFAPIDARDVLQRVAALPIHRWHYKVEGPEVTHVGPVAQDFYTAFGLGNSDKSIGTIDADGVALVAIQGLNAKVEEQQREIADLRRMLLELRSTMEIKAAMH